jgi:predicted RecA/RadA family phage recombinase
MGDWRSFKFTCITSGGLLGGKASWAAGEPWLYLVGDSVGALLESADVGDEGVLIYHAEKILVVKGIDSGDVFGVGDVVYWDPATRLVHPGIDSGYYRIGIATEPAAASEALVEIDLDGAGAAVRP